MIARRREAQKDGRALRSKRSALMAAFNAAADPMSRLEIHRKIQALPRNSAPTRIRNPLLGHRQTPWCVPATLDFAVTNCANGPTRENCQAL